MIRTTLSNHCARIVCAATLALTASGAFGEAGAPAATGRTSKGPTLVDARGMSLYTFDKDAGGKSACNDGCAALWPPLPAAAGATPSGDWTIISRDDGSRQWAYKGKPLYAFTQDAKAGDVVGDGYKSVWHIAKP
ncbi:Secreted repeat of unknown function [Methylocella silvestris BL2]|uniref:Lipoprotein with Yx(FWY)xxD motif n=1 Tax=Methylocella silvestris (strain DSM 15510 / CIP 108128 / LMG 27833 / NCIMB 13906 / BL2) TaxID=395965 RepID=B8EKF0_METSB|nr:hypothetical protein [Methylocella silvestris]ACK50690.1 Secreted repeat of unknown function [Methylocella silvestris BL2]